MDHLSSTGVPYEYGASTGGNKAIFGSPAAKSATEGITAAA
jgi:hypothetical protein